MARTYDREYMRSHAFISGLSAEDQRLIPQRGVKQYIFPDGDKHNAIWDYFVTPDKRHLFSLCAEGNFCEGFWLYEYFPETNTVAPIFKFDDTITNYPETIKASKIHTSMSAMEDGRIIFHSHTTAAAPSHPVWMPYSYRNHMWEGYPGSNMMIWDPKTNKVEDLGIPVRRESLYGGVYSPRARAVFSSTLMNGHIYRFDLADRKVTDYGNLTEDSCCFLKIATDGHVYFASNNGDLMRINTETLEYEDPGLRFTVDTRYKNQNTMRMMYAVNGPDGKMYCAPQHCELLQVFDPASQTLEVVGSVLPESLAHYPHYGMIYGMDFDEEGVLWYALIVHPQPNRPGTEVGHFLCSWDILGGGKPICYGLMGTEKRVVKVFCEVHITDGKFIGADTNHWNDPVSMFCVDLKTLKEDYAAGIRGPISLDAYHYTLFENGADIYPGDLGKDAAPLYDELEEERARTAEFTRLAGQWRFTGFKKSYVFKPWRDIGYDRAAVRAVKANADGTCTAICGHGPYVRYTLKEGEVLSREAVDSWAPEALPAAVQGVSLPSAAGRAWKANPTAAVRMHDGRYLVGTEDGLLGLVGEKGVYALGGIGLNGPINALCTTADGKTAYGIAGRGEELGMLIRYDDENGLVQLGSISVRDPRPVVGEGAHLNHLTALAVSADGQRLYIGTDDFKSAVVELQL